MKIVDIYKDKDAIVIEVDIQIHPVYTKIGYLDAHTMQHGALTNAVPILAEKLIGGKDNE